MRHRDIPDTFVFLLAARYIASNCPLNQEFPVYIASNCVVNREFLAASRYNVKNYKYRYVYRAELDNIWYYESTTEEAILPFQEVTVIEV